MYGQKPMKMHTELNKSSFFICDRYILANYPIESFDEYINPDFPQDLTNEVFYSSVKLNNVQLYSEQIKTLVYSNADKLETYDKLNDEYIAKYN